jgi:hypothetical protein
MSRTVCSDGQARDRSARQKNAASPLLVSKRRDVAPRMRGLVRLRRAQGQASPALWQAGATACPLRIATPSPWTNRTISLLAPGTGLTNGSDTESREKEKIDMQPFYEAFGAPDDHWGYCALTARARHESQIVAVAGVSKFPGGGSVAPGRRPTSSTRLESSRVNMR